MSDLASDAGEGRDHVADLPPGSPNAAPHKGERSPALSNNPPGTPLHGHGHHSTVSVDFFDPAGVNQLGRTLSRMSQSLQTQRTQSTTSSNETAIDPKFDLEKTLRRALRM